jgi:hypothetical protein
MSSSDGSSGSGSSSGSDQEDEQHVQQVITGANADPQVLQYFWDLASLQQVSCDPNIPRGCSDMRAKRALPSLLSGLWDLHLLLRLLTAAPASIACYCCRMSARLLLKH